MRFIVEHRKTARAHYLSGPNGSLLKYVSSDSTQEQTLYQQWTGKLPIEQSSVFEHLIWLLAEAGELRVIEPIAEWGVCVARSRGPGKSASRSRCQVPFGINPPSLRCLAVLNWLF